MTPDDGSDYQQPSLAADPQHPRDVALAYMLGGDARDRCGLALSHDGGASWRARTLIGRGGGTPIPEGFSACWNPSVAYGPHHSLHYLFQASLAPDNPYSHVHLMTSGDGGGSFSAPRPVDADPVAPGLRGGGDWWPSMAVDPDSGAVHVTWSSFTPLIDESRVYATRSADGGATFSPALPVSPPEERDVTGSVVAVGPGGAVNLAWLDYSGWERGFLASCPGPCTNPPLTPGEQERALIEHYAQQGRRLDFTQGVGCQGLRAVNFDRGGICDSPGQLRTATSPGGARPFEVHDPTGAGVPLGCTFQAGETSDSFHPGHACDSLHPSLLAHNLVTLTAMRSRGLLSAAWWDTGAVSAGEPGRVRIADSGNGGGVWDAGSTMPPPSGLAGDSQHRPSLVAARDGHLDVVYYDTAPDGRQDVFWTRRSSDGSFGAALRITDTPSSTAVGPRGDDGWVSVGDHLAALPNGDGVLAAWTDTRGGGHQAIYAAAASLPRESAGSHPDGSAIVAAALAAAAAGGGGAALALRRSRRRRASESGPSE